LDKLEKAKIGDVPKIQQLVNSFADRGEMLARPLSEIYENLRDYFIIREDDKIIGCCALHVSWLDLAEIKALAVAENTQRKGLGTQLVQACLDEAKELEIPLLFCLTYKPGFFAKQGFTEVDKMTLPKKVWTECFHCPKFPDCGETAMILQLGPGSKTD
jgi:amino-acid N-acetyltransferase